MSSATYTEARDHLAELWDRTLATREPIVVTRRGKDSVAILPADELSSLLETAHLLRLPRNAERLLGALARSHSGKGKKVTVAQLETKFGPARGQQEEKVLSLIKVQLWHFPIHIRPRIGPLVARKSKAGGLSGFALARLDSSAFFPPQVRALFRTHFFSSTAQPHHELRALLGSRSPAAASLVFTNYMDWQVIARQGLLAFDYHDVHRTSGHMRHGYDLFYRPNNGVRLSELPGPLRSWLPVAMTVFGETDFVATSQLPISG